MTELKQLMRKTELLTRRLYRIRAQKKKETIRLNELMAEARMLHRQKEEQMEEGRLHTDHRQPGCPGWDPACKGR